MAVLQRGHMVYIAPCGIVEPSSGIGKAFKSGDTKLNKFILYKFSNGYGVLNVNYKVYEVPITPTNTVNNVIFYFN